MHSVHAIHSIHTVRTVHTPSHFFHSDPEKGINGSKGSEKGNGTTWTETTLDAGKNVSLTSGRDTTLSGAQVSGEKVKADVGNNLTISSLQDSDRYDSRQN
ncbi:TPA: hypothetical protein JLL85_004870, partial [Escherichia coli]|nr:hypothetical protein [Escherichia coli]